MVGAQLVTFDSTVANGFPVIATVHIYPAEPDIGIWFPHAEDIELTLPSGKSANFILSKVSKADWERLAAEAITMLNEER